MLFFLLSLSINIIPQLFEFSNVIISDGLFFRVPVLVLVFPREGRAPVRLLIPGLLVVRLAVFRHNGPLFTSDGLQTAPA